MKILGSSLSTEIAKEVGATNIVSLPVRPKKIKINGKTHDVDPHQLMRMILNVTQTIGEYKQSENSFSSYVISALRKARADMVSDLESHFRIHWKIDVDGKSYFYM